MGKRGRRPFNERDLIMVQEFIFEGLTLKQIGERHGVSRERVRQCLLRQGVDGGRLNQKRHKMRRLYRYLIEYKKEHGGNTPSIREIIDGAELHVYPSARNTLLNLEELGLIEIIRTKMGLSKHAVSVRIVGEQWTPPEGWEQVFEPEGKLE